MRPGWRIALAAAFVAVGLGVAGLLHFRASIVERLAARELTARGLGAAAFRVEGVGLRSARVVDIALAPEIAARSVTLRYAILPPRLDRVIVEGLRLDLSRPDEGAFARLRESLGGGGEAGAIPAVELDDALVEADTPRGRFGLAFDALWAADEIELDGSLEQAGRALAAVSARGRPGAFEASVIETGGLTLTAKGGIGERVSLDAAAEIGRASALLAALGAAAAPPGRYRLQAAGSLEALVGAAEAQVETAFARITLAAPFAARRTDGGARVELNGAEIAAPERGLKASGVSGVIELSSAPTAKLAAERAETPWATPAALTLSGSLKDGVAQFEGAAVAGGARLSARGRHAMASGEGSLSLVLPKTSFGPARQPGAVLPALAALTVSGGAVSGSAALRWSNASFGGAGAFDLDALAFAAEGVAVDGLSGRLRFSELLPPRTPPGQELRAARIGAGADLADVRLRFALDGAAGALAVERLDAGFASGRLVVAGARLSPGPRNSAVLQVHDVDLAALLPLLGLEGLSGDGRLSGALPIAVADGKVAVEEGELIAAGPGALRFRSERVRSALAAGGEYVALALDALEDFRYERLSLSVDKTLEGAARIRLSTLGANPNVLEGHPFAINVNLTGDADNLVQAALAAWRLSDRALGAIVRGR